MEDGVLEIFICFFFPFFLVLIFIVFLIADILYQSCNKIKTFNKFEFLFNIVSESYIQSAIKFTAFRKKIKKHKLISSFSLPVID